MSVPKDQAQAELQSQPKSRGDGDGNRRERHYAWQDPEPLYDSIGKLSGLEYLQRELRGLAPPAPISTAMRFRLMAVEVGRVEFSAEPGEDFFNAVGGVQGGWLSGLLDATMGSAVHSTLAADVRYSTVEMKTNFVRPVSLATGTLTCIAKTIHAGRRLATAEGRITDLAGKLYAHGSCTCMITGAS